MTRSVASWWSADNGTISADLAESADSVIWTAPAYPGTYVVRADPQSPGEADQAEITMRVIHPRSTRLVKWEDRDYPDQNAGSGFMARVYVEPVSVSFGETEICEGATTGEADGFYASEFNLEHPVGVWQPAGDSNDAVADQVGIREPGYPPPFSPGHFRWTIPQYFRARGSGGAGSPFDVSTHTSVMAADGTETTTKQGATRTRTPAPAHQVPRALDEGGGPARTEEPHGKDEPGGPTAS
jgi:hypothetical protein